MDRKFPFIDIFNCYFEPENLRSALKVLKGAGYRVHIPRKNNGHPLMMGALYSLRE